MMFVGELHELCHVYEQLRTSVSNSQSRAGPASTRTELSRTRTGLARTGSGTWT